eukprot:1152839-Pelagomonas_calceolata.AAC.1
MGCGQKCRALFWRYVAHCSVQMHWCILGEANPKALMCPIQSAEGMTCNLHALSTSKLVVRVDKLLVLVFHTSTPLPDGSFSVSSQSFRLKACFSNLCNLRGYSGINGRQHYYESLLITHVVEEVRQRKEKRRRLRKPGPAACIKNWFPN